MVADIHILSQNISEISKSNFGTKAKANCLNPSVPIFPLDFPMILFPRFSDKHPSSHVKPAFMVLSYMA